MFCRLMTVTAITLTLTACGTKENVVTLKMAHALATSHPVHKAIQRLADLAREKSDSTLIIEAYPNEQLGNEKEMIEKLQLGAIAMTKVSSSMLENFTDEYKVFALPYLFRDDDHRWKVYQGEIGKKILESGAANGLKGLAYYDAGFRSFYTTKSPILHPDDLKGLKIRTQQSPVAMQMIDALGGSATPISWGELYTSLQQGVVDGAENNAPSLFTANHYEVAKHYSLDEHTSVPDVVIISTDVWNRLSEEHRQVLEAAVAESVVFQRQEWKKFVVECMEKMQAAGLKVYKPDKGPFQERAKRLWKEYDETVIGQLAEEILAVK